MTFGGYDPTAPIMEAITDGVNLEIILPKTRPKTSDLGALYIAMNLY